MTLVVGAYCGFGSAAATLGDESSIWVSRPDGAMSCEPGSGLTVEKGVEELRKEKIEVLEARKGTDGKMHIQMCGASEGTTIQVRIPKEALPGAKMRGYELVKKVTDRR